MDQNSKPGLFLRVSALLTGFNETELRATGMSESYYNTILQYTDKESVEYFFKDLEALFNSNSTDIEAEISKHFMPDSSYNGLAKKIIILWYTGNWGEDVVSSASYIQGLMWNAAHTHPPGAKQPGYGSWANLPLSINNSI